MTSVYVQLITSIGLLLPRFDTAVYLSTAPHSKAGIFLLFFCPLGTLKLKKRYFYRFGAYFWLLALI